MKKLLVVCFIAVFVVGGNIWLCSASNGKEVFVKKCGNCHKKGGDAPIFAPTKYASSQWNRFFKRNKHKRKKDIGSIFSGEELTAVKEYLANHAADSDQPEAVGLR